jgi:PTS system N-acetylglucosamine-specific IIC component
VTEPLEFSFMFVAPVLYVIHAFLTGVSVFIAASMHWMAGFGFSAGLVDMVLSSRNPLATNWYMLIRKVWCSSVSTTWYSALSLPNWV